MNYLKAKSKLFLLTPGILQLFTPKTNGFSQLSPSDLHEIGVSIMT